MITASSSNLCLRLDIAYKAKRAANAAAMARDCAEAAAAVSDPRLKARIESNAIDWQVRAESEAWNARQLANEYRDRLGNGEA